MDKLRHELNILKNDWTVVSESRAQINARLGGLPPGEERTRLEEERANITVSLCDIRQDISAMKAEVRRLREAERQGILSNVSFMPMLIILLILLTVFVLTYSYTVYLSEEMWSSSFIVALLSPLLSLSKVPTALEKMTSPTTFTAASSPPPPCRSLFERENTKSEESEPLLIVDDETQPLAECTGIRRRTAWSTTH